MIADRILKRHGYRKVKEDRFGARYEKEIPEYKYTRVLHISHRKCGSLVQCYDMQTHEIPSGRFINEGDSIESELLPAIYWKHLQLRRKYNWK